MEPLGVNTADEVAYAGGVVGTNNTSYYLYNNQYYWTMSPYCFYGSGAFVFRVDTNGALHNLRDFRVDFTNGVRPVINLKADTVFADGGAGTSSNPYVLQ